MKAKNSSIPESSKNKNEKPFELLYIKKDGYYVKFADVDIPIRMNKDYYLSLENSIEGNTYLNEINKSA